MSVAMRPIRVISHTDYQCVTGLSGDLSKMNELASKGYTRLLLETRVSNDILYVVSVWIKEWDSLPPQNP